MARRESDKVHAEAENLIRNWKRAGREKRLEGVRGELRSSDEEPQEEDEIEDVLRNRENRYYRKRLVVKQYLGMIREKEDEEGSDSDDERKFVVRKVNKFIAKFTIKNKKTLISILQEFEKLSSLKFDFESGKWREYEPEYKRKWTFSDGKATRAPIDDENLPEDPELREILLGDKPIKDYIKWLKSANVTPLGDKEKPDFLLGTRNVIGNVGLGVGALEPDEAIRENAEKLLAQAGDYMELVKRRPIESGFP